MAARRDYEIQTIGAFAPFAREIPELGAGEVGFFTAAIKEVGRRARRRHHHRGRPARAEPLPGFQPAKPMVFAGIFPTDSARYTDLRDALDKLRLNDASFTREPETSAALGFGFRCGFLGLLHMEIVQERLEREYDLDLITTAPTVRFRCVLQERRGHRARQPGQVPVRGRHRSHRGADHRRHHPHAAGVRRRHPQAVRGEARHADRPDLRRREARDHPLRAAADRDGVRLLRPAEVGVARLRLAGLRAQGLPRRPTWCAST